MKKLAILITLLSLILLAVLLPGCEKFGMVTGTGNIISKLYNFTGFTEIEIGQAFALEVVPLDSYSVSISARENLFDYVNVSQSGKTLKVGMKPLTYTNADLKAVITLPVLNRLSLSGAVHGTAKGFKSGQDFNLQESGASTLDLDVESGATTINLSGKSNLTGRLIATDAKMEVSGASRADLNGASSGTLTLNVSGASQANLPDFTLQNASVTLSGASTSSITVNGKLDVDLSGASTLNYSGNPVLGKNQVTGASSLNHQ